MNYHHSFLTAPLSMLAVLSFHVQTMAIEVSPLVPSKTWTLAKASEPFEGDLMHVRGEIAVFRVKDEFKPVEVGKLSQEDRQIIKTVKVPVIVPLGLLNGCSTKMLESLLGAPKYRHQIKQNPSAMPGEYLDYLIGDDVLTITTHKDQVVHASLTTTKRTAPNVSSILQFFGLTSCRIVEQNKRGVLELLILEIESGKTWTLLATPSLEEDGYSLVNVEMVSSKP